ncbi:NADH-quinone oxidoreductase subunit L [Aneurinibacillus thermoaerophilus]|uniref:NADH-quinone oxidoreductase subunit L n=2 Tax=Aneurinibacillus group TaxID=85151 RepID=A0A1G8A1G0_ANETH|nr:MULTISPECIES: NADH-quinone oxidoreductase subunit L [Aneurinibacillus]AMA74571.1 NADH:ubiquinone oxidoreductase subunit L [Aneurinibacillus sp. XH2]MED0676100.1 NADH-quinone oxidoreductase subunit L [Aneurinibacillus thermoaerophilus]MED0680800.1 NADH-quinone oxidoreductase subunit L [Aneurinibacillus thermoaerophilus]MED0738365.1 NADH-quinone oxidoreductase subunit L [Aneurinibacillus thermoaerophilus]MED0757637.1 NADH-quinone oxidoreductase subunit L [Aneurinibacillus thermoaerophilus]
MDMIANAWLIPLFPLIAFVLLVAFGRQWKERAAYVGILATAASFVFALLVFFERFVEGATDYINTDFHWLTFAGEKITMGFEVNQLNAMMLVVVTLVSMLVHIYSRGYMRGDERFPVFYQYLALFTFSMLGVVLSPNILQLYIFWELVGVCSFLLVGFYFYKPEARAAAKKAFIVTRIGDVGLFIALALIFWWVGSFDYSEIFNKIAAGAIEEWKLTLLGILIFVGAVGKSGQFPLHTWLPDAMEGPTPVSALIHAATMVAAGVYLVARMYDLYLASPVATEVVAYIGGFTAIFAASIGLTQRDIKRVLAYSTVSQLGYMMLALGAASAAGYVAGTFHLMTHAFFKALLFLAAGSVIHAVHTQDIFEMGGLWKKMRITGPVFLVGCLAIAGIPPFAGFWSKEEILVATLDSGHIDLFVVALIAASFTAFYMFRLFFLTFGGQSRGGSQAHESPGVMTLPMIVLAVLAVIAGFINTPWKPVLGEWLTEDMTAFHGGTHGAGWVTIVAIAVSVAGIALAWMMYGRGKMPAEGTGGVLYRVSFRKYYMDEIYDTVFVKPLRAIGKGLHIFDVWVIDGLVRLIAAFTRGIGGVGARMQNGQIQTYGAIAFIGLVLLIVGLTIAGGYVGQWRTIFL